jgi:acetyl-CoA acetyltransferase
VARCRGRTQNGEPPLASDVLERNTVISGIGISQIGRRTGRYAMDLTLESVLAAVDDAGLRREDVDGLASVGETPVSDLQDALRLNLTWNGGGMAFAGLLSPVVAASLAIAAGLARHVVIYRTVGAVNMGAGQGARRAASSAEASGRISGPMQWNVPYHVYGTMPAHAMMLRRHMSLYGTTKEQLGWIPVTERYHAGLNERATYREPMTIESYLESRPICEPISLFDCDVPVDGSVAIVLSAADHAENLDHPAVRINAVGGAISGRGFTWEQRTDFPKMMMFDAAQQLWSRSDLSPDDVDVAEIYDGFSFIALSWLEALGFCGIGEGGPFVEGGARIRLGGDLPINTYGGQLSAGRMHGYWLLHEACSQLRGEAGARQVEGAEVAVAAAGSGPFAGCMLLTRG